MLELWLTWKLVKSHGSDFFNPVTILALVGMALGVAALVTVMGVVSGFQHTLESAVTDVTGHILLIRRGEALDNLEQLLPRIKKIAPQIESTTPFVHVEGLVAGKGKIAGVVIQGLETENYKRTLNLEGRLVEGELNLGSGLEEFPPVVIGKGVKNKLGLEVGEILNIVLPKVSHSQGGPGFAPQLKKFKIVGVLDLGMYEYDSRFVLTSSRAAQKLAGIGPFFTGLRLKLNRADQASRVASDLSSDLGLNYFVRDWMESHYNLFEAIKLEKVVIFFVLLFMTIAACFNVASTLFISVLRRTHDIAILKTIGAKRGRIAKFFTLQGVILGVLGNIFGVSLGLVVCWVITHTNWIDVPPEIYHLNKLPVDIRWKDMLMIFIASLALCILSTWGPARRAARLMPIEGLRYE